MTRTWDVVRGEGPVVAAAIHNGHDIRPELTELMLLAADERRREEDPYTDVLAEAVPTRIVVRRSRFEIDLNRDRDEAVCVVPEDCCNLRVWNESLAAVSPSVLNQRLGELRQTGIVELTSQGYRLTRAGSELLSVLAPIDQWAKRWARSSSAP